MPSPTPPPPSISISISQSLVPSPHRLTTIQESPSPSPISPTPPTPILTSPTDRYVKKMMWNPPVWISLWFAVSSVLVIWDFMYCFLRPRSMEGGDLFWLWVPYKLYGEIDLIYSRSAYTSHNGFTNAQAFMNVIETILNIEYLYLAHTSARTSGKSSLGGGSLRDGIRKRGNPVAPLIGFAAAVMTLSKTLLYHLQEYYCGWCDIGHNDSTTLFWLWIVPNGLWILFPFLVVNSLGGSISASLRNHARDLYHEEETLLVLSSSSSAVPTHKNNIITNFNSNEEINEIPSSDPEESQDQFLPHQHNTLERESTPSVSVSGSVRSEVRKLRSRDVSLGAGGSDDGMPMRRRRGEGNEVR